MTVENLREAGFIAIFRNIPPEKLIPAAKAVYRGGVKAFEITFNPSDEGTVDATSRAIAEVRTAVGSDCFIGAGTVVKPEYVDAAYRAGAEFIVSPDTDAEVIRLTKERGMLAVPGAFTPTEIVSAYRMGADIVKIFPVLPDNIAYLRTILAPLSYIPFIPTGGVNSGNAGEFLSLGAVAVAAGATVLTPKAVGENDWSAVEKNARLHIEAVRKSLTARR